MTRKWEKPIPQQIPPVHVPAGFYLPLTDYARREGMTRLTAYNRARRGEIHTVRLGERTVLVKITNRKLKSS